ncbi:MAG: DUF721 domain-containing protein [Chlamydiota bacterium]
MTRRNFTVKSKKNKAKGAPRAIRDLLPAVLQTIEQKVAQRPDQILASWSTIVTREIATMTRAVSFESGVLRVCVTHSTLYSLLVEHEKKRLLARLKKKFPAVEIRDIVFRIG